MLSKGKILTCSSDQYEPLKCGILAADNLASLYFDHSAINISFYNKFAMEMKAGTY